MVLTADLFTIGYEGSTLPRVLAALHAAGVRHLVDVRAIPQSRKPGFSRRVLEASVADAGLRYTHLRGLGTPKPGRDAARRGDTETMHRVFAAQMQSDQAQVDLAHAVAIVREGGACLLCFEADHRTCHRSIVAGLIGAQVKVTVRHLVPAAD